LGTCISTRAIGNSYDGGKSYTRAIDKSSNGGKSNTGVIAKSLKGRRSCTRAGGEYFSKTGGLR
jgi:hypothetical protein